MDLENLQTLARHLHLERVRAGTGNLVCSCPFAFCRHIKADGSFGVDRKASFGIKINPDGVSHFNCFSCTSSGDLLWLLTDLGAARDEDYSHLEEFIWDKETMGAFDRAIELPDLEPRKLRKAQLQLIDEGTYPEAEYDEFRDKLPVDYIQSRSLPVDVCRAWGLGHDPDEGRLMFPIRRQDGRLVGLKGRSYRGHKNKYIPYLPFNQGDFFYGEHMLRPEEEDPRIVIVEGEIDVLKVWMAGYSCMGIMGGMATRAHRQKLELLERPLVLMPDANNTGEVWASRLGKLMKNIVNVFDVYLPGGDPGDLSSAQIKAYVESASLRL